MIFIKFDKMDSELSSPSRNKRLGSLNQLLLHGEVDPKIIQTLIDIESVPSNISEYRDRERHLETLCKLLFGTDSTDSETTQLYTFRYLLGSLYVNFEKFWGPTIRIILEILNQTKYQKSLLEVLLCHLQETNSIIYDDVGQQDPSQSEDRPDHILHRNFIFQLMSRYPQFIESNSRRFMEEFFLFVKKELLVSPFVEKYGRCDLTQRGNDSNDNNGDAILLEESSDRVSKGSKRFRKKGASQSVLQKRKSRETFITATKIIQLFKNIEQIHRHEDLKILISDLLCCRDSSVQRAAFNCLLAYKIEGLKPYTDKVLKILNEKKVRTELSIFSIDAEESDQVLPHHRGQLIPILQRILFGRMIGQVGRKSSGRDKADVRKTLVMRFIAGCNVEEIIQFFRLLFEPLFEYADVPYNQLKSKIDQNLNYQTYLPLNKIHAMLTSLSAYIETVAHLRPGSLSYVLKLINIITYYVVAPLENPETQKNICNRNLDLLKSLRRSCLNILNDFYKAFEYYQYSQDEIDFSFEFLIWPSCRGFIDKNHASITPFLRLIETFAKHETYHALLVKRRKLDRGEYLLKHVISLYQDSKTNVLVLKFLASIIASILKPDKDEIQDDDLDNETKKTTDHPMLSDIDAVEPEFEPDEFKVQFQMPFGHRILLSFIPTIFERMKANCQEFIDKKDIGYRIENDELIVLSLLSQYLKDSQQSLVATKLLLTSLDQHKNNDLIVKTLKTAQSLMSQVNENTDPTIVTYVANILGYQRNREQRAELCKFVRILADIDCQLIQTSRIIELLNAFNEEFVDSPDLTRWNEGFQMSFDYLDGLDEDLSQNPEKVRDSLILLTHQAGFISNSVDRYEFSVRENCYTFYEKLAAKIKRVDTVEKSFLRLILNDILLEKFVKKGLRDTNEAIKHTYIEILRTLALHCHEKNSILKDINMFCSSNLDLDFWKNVKHIQLHNRSRALARLISNEDLIKVSPKTLSAYFMPIAAGFLFNKAYKTVASLSDNSIKLIGIICKHLNWVTYESTLSYYLGLLTKANATYQKTNIKLITEIVKNFNFDLSGCEEAMQHEEENKKLEKRMKKRIGARTSDTNLEMTTIKKLNPSTAKMVYMSITKKLIPRLNSCLHEMTRVEFEHDKNMSDYKPEKDEIKRIPIAFAIVQLLSLLPGRYVLFRDHLPALFLKLVSFLKSKNQETREASRMTLIKIMTFEAVGPAYMPDLIRIMKQNLDKGFYVHVLNYTINSVLDKLRDTRLLYYGDLDSSAHELVDSCLKEIFGAASEDKEVAKIVAKTFEAKKTKSYDTLAILAMYISAEKLDFLLDSIKDHIKLCSDPKKINKLAMCLQNVFSGLAQNDGFPIDKLFAFIQTTIEESIPSLKVRQIIETDKDPSTSRQHGLFREDRFIIAKERTKEPIKSKINERGNMHMLVENSLRLLLAALEKHKSEIKKRLTLQGTLNGMIGVLSTCLKSSSPACVTRALKCIHFIAQAKADLPSFKTKSNSIVKKIFILLNLYNGVGMVQGENFEMIGMCFKTVTLLLLRCEHVNLDEAQIQALMTYIAQDLSDTSRQNTAFSTLTCLLHRKCESPELPEIMIKVGELLVTSSDDNIRTLAIKAWQIYLLDYKHDSNVLQTYLSRFLRQLDYEHIDGRKSVIKMLRAIVEKFPERILRDHLELFFHLLAQRIVNDDSQEVRHSVGYLIALLIQRLPDKQPYLLNQFVFVWACGKNPGLKILGIKLLSIYLEACKGIFEKKKERVGKVLEIISGSIYSDRQNDDAKKQIDNKNEVSFDQENGEDEKQTVDTSESVRLLSTQDKLTYHSLRLFKRLLTKDLITCVEPRYIESLKKIWQNIAKEQLSHWNEKLVLTSCELYLIFIRNTELSKSLSLENPNTDNYLDWNARRIVRLLCDKYLDLLDRFDKTSDIFNYVMETMIILGQMVANSFATLDFEQKYCDSFDNGDIMGHLLSISELPNDGFVHEHLPYQIIEAKKRADLMWLSIKVVMQARKEAALYRLSQSYRRDFVLKWSAAIAQELGPKRIAPYVCLFIMTPVRELTDKMKGKINQDGAGSDHSILIMSEDLLKFLKSLVGVEIFNKIYSKVQLHYTKKRVDRKKSVALMKVKDQARGVKRRIKLHKSKETKRRANKATARKRIIHSDIRDRKRLRV